jgi:hypothetical protein
MHHFRCAGVFRQSMGTRTKRCCGVRHRIDQHPASRRRAGAERTVFLDPPASRNKPVARAVEQCRLLSGWCFNRCNAWCFIGKRATGETYR